MAPIGRKRFQERIRATEQVQREAEPTAPPAPPSVVSPLLVLTDRSQSEAAGRRLIDTVAAAVDAGARTIVLREKDLSRAKRYLLALSLTDLLVPEGAGLVVASDVKTALDVGAVAVHLAATDPVPDTTAWPTPMVWGRSCHSVDDVARAAADGAGYVTVSPVFASASKPGYGPPLGAAALARAASAIDRTSQAGDRRTSGGSDPGRHLGITRVASGGPTERSGNRPPGHGSSAAAEVPLIYALGGITPENTSGCVVAGAAGVAVMGGVMAAPDPGEAVAAYLAELAASTSRPGNGREPSGPAEERP